MESPGGLEISFSPRLYYDWAARVQRSSHLFFTMCKHSVLVVLQCQPQVHPKWAVMNNRSTTVRRQATTSESFPNRSERSEWGAIVTPKPSAVNRPERAKGHKRYAATA